MQKINIHLIRELAEAHNWKCKSHEYHNLTTLMEFECPVGHDVYITWKNLRENFECPTCLEAEHSHPHTNLTPKQNGHKRLLALDQATYTSGYAIFDDNDLLTSGIFKSSKSDEISRDNEIKQWFLSLICAYQIDKVVFEGIQLEVQHGVNTFLILARLQGILMEACYGVSVPCLISAPATWRAKCGIKAKTRADMKASAKTAIKNWYGINVTDDEADAICIGHSVLI